MRGTLTIFGAAWVRPALVAMTLLCSSLGRNSIGDSTDLRDPCELKALDAYAQALRLCQFEQNANPRLRCYETARQVYLQTLEECRQVAPR